MEGLAQLLTLFLSAWWALNLRSIIQIKPLANGSLRSGVPTKRVVFWIRAMDSLMTQFMMVCGHGAFVTPRWWPRRPSTLDPARKPIGHFSKTIALVSRGLHWRCQDDCNGLRSFTRQTSIHHPQEKCQSSLQPCFDFLHGFSGGCSARKWAISRVPE